MKPIRIDFGTRAPAAPWWALSLFAVAFAACGWEMWHLGAAEAALIEVRRDAQSQRDLLAMRAPAAVPARFDVAPARIVEINRAIRRLNLPWDKLFEALEAAKPENVALLALEPDAEKQVLKIGAEARDSAAMLDFVQALAARPAFGAIHLVKHEINEQDAMRPFRFQIEAHWKDSP